MVFNMFFKKKYSTLLRYFQLLDKEGASSRGWKVNVVFQFERRPGNNTGHRINSHLTNHCPTSEGVSEVSERANKWAQQSARAKRAGRSKLEWAVRANERTDERVAQFFSLYSWLFSTIVFCNYLDSRFWEIDFESDFFPHENVRVSSFGEEILQHFQLSASEGRPFPPLFSWRCGGENKKETNDQWKRWEMDKRTRMKYRFW